MNKGQDDNKCSSTDLNDEQDDIDIDFENDEDYKFEIYQTNPYPHLFPEKALQDYYDRTQTGNYKQINLKTKLAHTQDQEENQQQPINMEAQQKEIELFKRNIEKKQRLFFNQFSEREIYVNIFLSIAYYLCLEACPHRDFETCQNLYLPKLPIWMVFVASYYFFIFQVILSSFFQKRFLATLMMILQLMLIFNQKTGFDWQNHSGYFKYVGYALGAIYSIIYLILKIGRFLYQRCKRVSGILLLGATGVSAVLIYNFLMSSGIGWDSGFNNLKINDSLSECQVQKPVIENYRSFDFIVGFVHKLEKMPCDSDQIYDSEVHLIQNRSFYEDTNQTEKFGKAKYQAYGRTQDFSDQFYEYFNLLQQYVVNNTKVYETKQEIILQKKYDFFINFEDPKHPFVEFDIQNKSKINVLKSDKLTNSQKKQKDRFGVIYIVIDAVSRRQFHRKFPKTSKYLEKFYKHNNNYKNMTLSSEQSVGFEFFKTQALVPFTKHNFEAIRYGITYPNFQSNDTNTTISIDRVFRENNYVTAYSTNMCGYYESLTSDYPNNDKDTSRADHEYLGPACDPNQFPYEQPLGLSKGPFSMHQKCFLRQDAVQQNLDFSLAVLKKYKEMKTGDSVFQFNYFIDAHEFTHQVVTYIDEPLLNYVKELERTGLLDENMLIISSDHGMHLPPLNIFGSGLVETGNFLLNVLYPKRFLDESKFEAGVLNTQRLVTHSDMHKTLVKIGKGYESQKDFSQKEKEFYLKSKSTYTYYDLFEEEVPFTRKCSDFMHFDKKDICICDKFGVD